MLAIEDVLPVHYAPDGERPLCGDYCHTVVSDRPELVRGCEECLQLVAEDLADTNWYHGRCLECHRVISARGGVEWRRAVRRPCPHCGTRGW